MTLSPDRKVFQICPALNCNKRLPVTDQSALPEHLDNTGINCVFSGAAVEVLSCKNRIHGEHQPRIRAVMGSSEHNRFLDRHHGH